MLAVALMTISLTYGQSKKDLEIQVASLQSQMDSVSAALQGDLDSMTQSRDNYKVVYDQLREKVVTFDFAPENFASILDSFMTVRQHKDSAFQSMMSGSEVLRDTIATLSSLNDSLTGDITALKAENEKLKLILKEFKVDMGIEEEEIEEEVAEEMPVGDLTPEKIQELKSLKELLDGGILTQEEFDARKKKILGN